MGEIVYYDQVFDGDACQQVFQDDTIGDETIQWRIM